MRTIIARSDAKFTFGILAIMALVVLCPAVINAAPDFKAMLKACDELGNFNGQDASMVYSVVNSKVGEPDSRYQWSIFRRDLKEQIVILFLQPDAKKGNGILKIDDDIYTYSPDAGFTHSSMSKNIEDSNAKSSDLGRGSYAEDYDIVASSEAKLGKYDAYVLDLKAKTKDVSYEWIRLYLRKDKPLILKEEDYSVNGISKQNLLRSVQYPPKYIEAGGKTVPTEIRIVDEVVKGNKSVMTIDSLSVAKLPDSNFTKAFLEQASQK